MRRAPLTHASPPGYPDRVRSPWALGLVAAGGLALGSAALGGCQCLPVGEPVQVQEPVPLGGVAPRVDPLPPPSESPVPETIPEAAPGSGAVPEVTPGPEADQPQRMPGSMPRPALPSPSAEEPTAPAPPPEVRIDGGLTAPEQPVPPTP